MHRLIAVCSSNAARSGARYKKHRFLRRLMANCLYRDSSAEDVGIEELYAEVNLRQMGEARERSIRSGSGPSG